MPVRKRKNTSGIKHVSKKSELKHRGELIPVNSRGSGIYTNTAKKVFELFDQSHDRWGGRTLLVIFILLPNRDCPTNKMMTLLNKRINYHFEHDLGISEFGFYWTREQDKRQFPHYHFATWLDGDKYRTSHSISPIVKRAWEEMGGTVTSVIKPFHFVYDAQTRAEALYRLSYFAKARGKGNRPTQTKDHGMSRLRKKEKA